MTTHGQQRSMRLHYLVGGLRISIADDATTPGPRSHIVGFVNALEKQGVATRITMSSDLPGMSRFSRVRQADYTGASPRKKFLTDAVRLLCGIWCSTVLRWQTRGDKSTQIIYERVATYQWLTAGHARRRHALRIAEANGVLARESAQDRQILGLPRLASALERRVLQRADLVVAVSENLKTELISFASLDAYRVLVVPNAAPRALFRADVKESVEDSPIVVGFAGSMTRWHRLDQLLHNFARVSLGMNNSRQLRLELVGDGPELEVLQALVRVLKLEDIVTFCGRLSHEETLTQMSAWTVGFAGHEKSSSATMYHSPLKLYEYAALGLIVVCTPSADAETLRTDGTPIFQFSPGESESFKSAFDAAVAFAASDTMFHRQSRRNSLERQHSWDSRALTLLEAVEARVGSS